jgi:hypothetical protein
MVGPRWAYFRRFLLGLRVSAARNIWHLPVFLMILKLSSAFLSSAPSASARAVALAAVLILGFAPQRSLGCACGCGVFEVGTSSMLPSSEGGMLFFNDDFQDQNHNWSGTSQAPAGNNADKEISTNFFTTGLQYMFNRNWGAQIEIPYDSRYFKTTGGATGDDIVSLRWSQLGDIRLQGIYTGFSPDLSTGLTFGLKLPSGSYTRNDAYGDIDRDTEIGTGSTDLLLGAFHRGNLGSGSKWQWFAQASLDQPFLFRDGYRPGLEADAAIGINYQGWTIGSATITPIAQVIGSDRARDSGPHAANPVASGYQRVLLSPGIEINFHPVHFYADVERPVYQHMTGNQLVAPALFKLSASIHF